MYLPHQVDSILQFRWTTHRKQNSQVYVGFILYMNMGAVGATAKEEVIEIENVH